VSRGKRDGRILDLLGQNKHGCVDALHFIPHAVILHFGMIAYESVFTASVVMVVLRATVLKPN
jgi:hypothetical protein